MANDKELTPSQLIELAQKAQKQRRAIKDDLSVSGTVSLPLKELTKMYMPDTFGKNAKYHAFWGLDNQVEQTARKGYEPVLTETKEHLRHEKMVAWKIPSDIYKKEMKRNAAISEAMLGRKSKQSASARVQEAEAMARSNKLLESEEFEAQTATEENLLRAADK